MKFQYSGKLYLEINGERVLGPGRVQLLEGIRATGSIRQAAREMGMSYRQAWQHLEHMNSHFGVELVSAERGGKGGGQTIVTEKGEAVIQEFKKIHSEFQVFLLKNTFSVKA